VTIALPRRGIFLAPAAALLLAGCGLFGASSSDSAQNFQHFFSTAPAPCPDDPDNLAGIEGWAPGAGKAAVVGQTNAQNFGGFGGALGGGGGATPTPAATPACTGISPELYAYYQRLDATLAAIPKDGYDAPTRGGEIQSATDAFAFVRDSIATEAYASAMRGANGTLAANGGSPADKALLLAALLSVQNIPVRFVHAPLAAADAATVVHAALTASPKVTSTDSGIVAKLGLDPTQVASVAADQRARIQKLADTGLAEADTATTALLAKAPGVQLGTSTAAVQTQWATNVQDHWWVQAQTNGQWTDYDPTLPGATPGTHLGPAPSDPPASALPDAAYATVALTLAGDFVGAAGITTKTLVTATAKTSDLALSSFQITIGDHSKGAKDLDQATNFTPELRLGEGTATGDAFTADASDARLAVLHLTITVHVPGQPDRTSTRTLVDRRTTGMSVIDPSWTPARTALALTATYAGLVVSGELNRDFTVARDAESAKLARAFTEYVTAGGNARQLPPPGIAEAYPYEVMHYFLYDSIARMRLEDRAPGAVRFFFDRPQIAMVHRGFMQAGQTRVGVLEFDVVDNGMTAAGSDAAGSIHANAVRGYVDTNVERRIFGFEPTFNTIALFAAADKAGVATTVTPAGSGVHIAPSSAVALNGRVVSGWWDLDPQSGNLIGRMQGGAGQAMVEYAIERINDWSSLVTIMQFYGDFFRCIAMGVEAPLSGEANPQASFNNCALGALCNLAEATIVGEGFSRCQVCSNIDALIYNFLDYGTYGKSSSPGSFGAACGALFPSPFSS
jgi:hypothetical protein